MISDQDHCFLLYLGDYTTQLYRDHDISITRIPMNQSVYWKVMLGFNVKTLLGFCCVVAKTKCNLAVAWEKTVYRSDWQDLKCMNKNLRAKVVINFLPVKGSKKRGCYALDFRNIRCFRSWSQELPRGFDFAHFSALALKKMCWRFKEVLIGNKWS